MFINLLIWLLTMTLQIPSNTQNLYPWRNTHLHWRAPKQIPLQQIDPHLLPWLRNPDSFTATMKAASEQNVEIKVISQRWGLPQHTEAIKLGIPLRENVLIREVEIWGDNKPWVYARTIIPRSTLTGKERRLINLGNKPIGELIFNDPSLERTPFEWVHLKENQKIQWGRRSIFYINKKPLLVTEFLLPNLPKFPTSNKSD